MNSIIGLNEVQTLRADIINAIPSLAQTEHYSQWWLLGTAGCHLCTTAQNLMSRLQAVEPVTFIDVDISDFDESLMMVFATAIPVLLTKDQRLNYPFSVLDLQLLL